eukprot:1220262-Rhodomonas_salina.2
MNRARWGPLATDWEQPSSVRELETEMANLNMGAARHEGLSREALTYALQAAEIRLAQATNPKRNRGSHGDFPQRMTERLSRPPPGARSPWGSFSPPRSGSPVSPRAGGGQGYGGGGGGDPGGSFARPKLQRPSTFRGDYDELYNILNWVYAVDRYLNQCRCSAGDFSGYARTYLDNTVQAYIDSLYSHSIPSWDELRVALIKRYLPPDHVIRVELLFGKLQQRSTLMNYVEQFQVMDAALRFSEIEISNTRKVMQFLQGMREMEERQFLLERDPKSLADLYEGVIICRQAKLLASNLQRRKSLSDSSPDPERQVRVLAEIPEDSEDSDDSETPPSHSQILKLEGKERQKAWDEGRCLGCGAKDHLIAGCPQTKRAIKRFTRRYTRSPKEPPGPARRKPTRKFTKLAKEGADKEAGSKAEKSTSDEDEHSQNSGSSSSNSDPGHGG